MKRKGPSRRYVIFRDAHCAVLTLLQSECARRTAARLDRESWQGGDESALDCTLLGILSHQLEHVNEDAEEHLDSALAALGQVAELLVPVVDERAAESSDPLVRHAALMSRALLRAVVHEAGLDDAPLARVKPARLANGHRTNGSRRA